MACVPQPLTWVSVIAAAAAAAVPGTSREPVLKQIRLPHAYYYREMYVPQVTSGPTSATWSPDGQELIYSMQGSLWRQRIGSIEATQVTSGDGYDYQPDWSPDGRHVVYATYRNDAVELWLLDLTRGDDPRDRGARRRQRRPALVAGRLATGVRVDVARRPLARLRRADRRRADRRSRARHGGS